MSFRRATLVAVVAVLAVAAFRPAAAAPPCGLARVFAPGWILVDGNGDGDVDGVAVRIVLADDPAPEEIAAAAELAARWGLESSGLGFPLATAASAVEEGWTGPRVVLGRSPAAIGDALARRAAALGPGRGLVRSEGDRVVVTGADPAGVRAAALAFAARAPYVWDVVGRERGDTFERVAADIAGVLVEGGAAPASVCVEELVYEKDRAEALAITVRVRLGPGGARAARRAVEAVAADHRAGRRTDRLSFSSAARLVLVLDEEGGGSETVAIERVGVPERLLTPPRIVPPSQERVGAEENEPTERDFDLSDPFRPGALLDDEDGDGLADRTATSLVLAAARGPADPRIEPAHLAARIGLESLGGSFPLARLDTEIDEPGDEPTLVLLGGENRLARELARIGKWRAPVLAPGRGRVDVVPGAFGATRALVVSGGDRAGAEAAAAYLARRAPYLGAVGRGRPSLEEIEDEVRRLVEGRAAAGQAALALARVDAFLRPLDAEAIEGIDVRLFLEKGDAALDAWLAAELARAAPGARVDVTSRGLREPEVVFEDEPIFEWEVDALRRRLREAVLPRIGPGQRVDVAARVSEAPELRAELAREIAAAIEEAGGRPGTVEVLSAYKQGLFWLLERVAPALAGASVASIEIGWRPFPVDLSEKRRFHSEPARWLAELYPVDELLAARLGLPLEAIGFARRDDQAATYTVVARDAAGAVVHRDAFSPATYERPYLDAFPEAARVVVTTGWLRAAVDGAVVVDERVPTDLDRVWAHYQGSVLARVREAVLERTGGKPTRERQPFFHTLRFELEASEPDFRLGLDEELVSSLESIHDDVYFDTLDFFYELVERAEGKPVPSRRLAPGRILPWIHPERRGRPPRLRVVFSQNAAREPRVEIAVATKSGETHEETFALPPASLARPSACAVEVEAGRETLARAELCLRLDDEEAARRVVDGLDGLARLRDGGVAGETLRYADVETVAVRVEAPGATVERVFPRGAPPPPPPAPEPYPGRRIVAWDHVIAPEESERIAATLGTLPEVTTYVAGRSYEGRPVSVMELRLPVGAELVSQAKLAAWKPVLSIMARQHANEVSSTSHVLRLAELLATDPAYRRYLERINVVIQPVVNPDGAALAYELQKLTPYHCLHAGRYSALGPDVPREASDPRTLVTEALVLEKVFETWRPDIQLNPHGYPTHEWVQGFAGYNPPGFRSYWIPRGWWTSIRPIEDPRYEHHREAARRLRDRIARNLARDPELRETNRRFYDRYRRWAVRFQPHVYELELHDGTAIYWTRTGPTAARPDPRAATTVFSGFTEAMDETAQGAWLETVARMGLAFVMASVEVLAETPVSLYRLEEERRGRVVRAATRPRPLRLGGPRQENEPGR